MSSFENEPYDPVLAANIELAEHFEQLAQNYDEEYRDGAADGCYAVIGSTSLGREIEVSTSFSAERIRAKGDSLKLQKVILSEYGITSIVTRHNLSIDDIPVGLHDTISKVTMRTKKGLREPSLPFSLGFDVSFDVTSDGAFDSKHGLYVLVGGETVNIKKRHLGAIAAGTQPHEIITNDTDWARELFSPEEFGALAPTAEDILDNIFSFEEATILEELSRQVAHNAQSHTPFGMMLKQTRQFKKAVKRNPHQLARRLANQLFMPEQD